VRESVGRKGKKKREAGARSIAAGTDKESARARAGPELSIREGEEKGKRPRRKVTFVSKERENAAAPRNFGRKVRGSANS